MNKPSVDIIAKALSQILSDKYQLKITVAAQPKTSDSDRNGEAVA